MKKGLEHSGAATSTTEVKHVPPEPRTSASHTVTVAAGTRIERVTVEIGVKPPGLVDVAGVAEVRAAPGGTVLDFGRMRTVAGFDLSGTASPTGIYAWLGAAFSTKGVLTDDHYLHFGEVLTERLMIKGSPADVTVAKVQASRVRLPGAPSDAEIVVGGRRVWFQGGELKRGAQGMTAAAGDYFVATVDVTEAVITASAADPAVVIELRTATAGVLSLAVKTELTRVHEVTFPEGAERVVNFAEEGARTLDLPLPAGSHDWHVAEVWFDVVAKLDARRVVPAVGPAISTAAELVLDPDHPVALLLPGSELARFGALAGVRLRLHAEEGSAELAAVVLADADGAPGEVIAGGELSPLALEAATAAGWATLELRRPLPLRGRVLWLAVQVSRGRVVMQLGAAGGVIQRGRPGGPWRAFSTQVAVTPTAAVRVIGEPTDGPPLPALEAKLSGATPVTSIPTADGAMVQLVPAPAIVPTGNQVQVQLEASAPGTYRFREARVFYRITGDGGA